MKHTSKWYEGYRYYVYVAPGTTSYFFTLSAAIEYMTENNGEVGEVV